MTYDRRKFIKQSALAAGGISLLGGATFSCTTQPAALAGTLHGPSVNYGHLLRQAIAQKVSHTKKIDTVIVGGGVSGLSAAKKLKEQGIDFSLLELEPVTGGNARSANIQGQNCPWGAHYLPLPSAEMPELIAFLEEIGVVTGRDANALPQYKEDYLTFAPQERLFRQGFWQKGLVPSWEIPTEDQQEINRFIEETDEWRYKKGKDGKYAFALPVAHSSSDEAIRALDNISMQAWLKQQGYKSEYLNWYVNYSCRDDYGSNLKNTSAWAGLHYFCSRRYSGEQEGVLTWPEGNAWLVNRLKQQVEEHCAVNSLVFKVEPLIAGVAIHYLNTDTKEVTRIEAQNCIMAIPQFVAAHLLPARQNLLHDFIYTPWLTANIALKHEPQFHGQSLCWDNVIYNSNSLGYVHANHQELETIHSSPVITYYEPLSELQPAEARKWLLNADYANLQQRIYAELKVAHPAIHEQSRQCDIWRWGHGMISPQPGFIWGESRMLASEPLEDKILFAHTDLGGVSVFEEAFYQGLNAANLILKERRV